MIYLLQPVDFRSDNNAQKAPILLCKDKIESGCCSKSRYHKPINFQRTNLWSADPWVWGYQRKQIGSCIHKQVLLELSRNVQS